MKHNEKLLQQSLKVLQQHLSEERARVAKLHSQLVSFGDSRAPSNVPVGTDGDAKSAQHQPEFVRAFAHGGAAPGGASSGLADQEKSETRGGNTVLNGNGRVSSEGHSDRSYGTGAKSTLRYPSFSDEDFMENVASLKELAMDSVQEGVTIADFSLPDQPLIYANHGFELISGYSIEETIGHNCRFLQGPNTEPEKLAHIKESIRKGVSCTVQLKNYRKDGTEFINHLSLTPIRTRGGRVTHYVGIQSDVSDLIHTRQAELEALKKATIAEAATDAKSKFLAHMSHEIRTPLNGLIAVGQLLEETTLSRMQRDYVTTIRSSGETLQALISDILDFSRVEADKLVLRSEPFQPQAVIATVMKIVGLHSSRLRLNIGYHVDDGVPEVVVGDAMRVQQVLLNTLNNAIKFTEKGDIMIRLYICKPGEAEAAANRSSEAAKKKVEEELMSGTEANHADRNWREEATRRGMTIHAAKMASMDWLEPICSEDARAEDRSLESGRSCKELSTSGSGNQAKDADGKWVLHFYVRDTGIGLDSTNIKTIFNSFQQVDLSPTRKYDGTGLGLAISQRLCEAMGGRMWVESPGLGMGSTFHFSIHCDPLQSPDQDVGEATEPGAPDGIDVEMVSGGAPADPLINEKQAAARRRVRASGADTKSVKTLVRTPSAMSFLTTCKGREIRVLLYDESGMVRQTLKSVMMRWGLAVTAVSTPDDIIKALNEGMSASPGVDGGPYSIFVAEKNNGFVKAIRRWASSHGKLETKSPSKPVGNGDGEGRGGENVAISEGRQVQVSNGNKDEAPAGESKAEDMIAPKAAFHCPAFILMTWPNFTSSDDDINSWGDIRSLNLDSNNNSEGRGNTDASGFGVSQSDHDEVQDFLSSRDAEVLPKPVQHARLQKLLAVSAAHHLSTGETSHEARKLSDGNMEGVEKSCPEPASSADRDHIGSPVNATGVPPTTANALSKFKPSIPRDMRVLLAEDHPINMKVACAVLARCGHKDITLAKDGVEVLEKLAALPSGLDSFDIVLMDLHMPRMGGIECVRRLRQLYPDSKVPIVAVTADAVEDSRDRCMQNGFNAWISKPFRIEQLAGLLDEFVPGSGAGTGKAGGG